MKKRILFFCIPAPPSYSASNTAYLHSLLCSAVYRSAVKSSYVAPIQAFNRSLLRYSDVRHSLLILCLDVRYTAIYISPSRITDRKECVQMMDKYCPHCIVFFQFLTLQFPLIYTLPLIQSVNSSLKMAYNIAGARYYYLWSQLKSMKKEKL